MTRQKNLMIFNFTIFPSNLKTQIKIYAFLNHFSICFCDDTLMSLLFMNHSRTQDECCARAKPVFTLVGGPWTRGGLMLDFACYIQLYMALLPVNFHNISVMFYKYPPPPPLRPAVVQYQLPTDAVMLSSLPQFSAAVRSLDHELIP